MVQKKAILGEFYRESRSPVEKSPTRGAKFTEFRLELVAHGEHSTVETIGSNVVGEAHVEVSP